MTNSVGDAIAFSGGIHVDLDVDFNMTRSLVVHNSVRVSTAGSPGNAHGDSGGGQLIGNVRHTLIRENTVTVKSTSGNASAAAGGSRILGVLPVVITDSVVAENHVRATSGLGSVSVFGAGLVIDTAPDLPNGAGLTLNGSTVKENTANAKGPRGYARGGGIFDAAVPPEGPFGGPLALMNSSVTGNVLAASADIVRRGGGIYISGQPLSLRNSMIAKNVPDQCFGCS